MIHRKRAIRHLVLTAIVWSVAASVAGGQNVVIVVIDGVRYSESFGAGEATIPALWSTLRPQGFIWTNFRNEGITYTCPGHASIESGTWQDLPNDGSERPTSPTLFEYFRRHTGLPDSSCALIVGKAKLEILSHSTHPEYGQPYGAPTRVAGDDIAALDSARSVFSASAARLVLVHLPDVDVAGHAGDFAAYLAAIRRADSLTAEMWSALCSQPFYAGTTTMLVTNDHGRHDDANGGFQSHGDSCEGCRHIMLLAMGRGIPAGRASDAPCSQINIAPTVGFLLGFPTPLAAGGELLPGILASASPEPAAPPGAFALLESFPNPFNGTTRIACDIPAASHVQLAVHDVLGRQRAMLLDSPLPAGRRIVTFDAASLPSGVYVVRLVGSGFAASSRILLIK